MERPVVRKLNLQRAGVQPNPSAGNANVQTFGDLRSAQPHSAQPPSIAEPVPQPVASYRPPKLNSARPTSNGVKSTIGQEFGGLEIDRGKLIKSQQRRQHDILRPSESGNAQQYTAPKPDEFFGRPPMMKRQDAQGLLEGPTTFVEPPKRAIRSVQEKKQQAIPISEHVKNTRPRPKSTVRTQSRKPKRNTDSSSQMMQAPLSTAQFKAKEDQRDIDNRRKAHDRKLRSVKSVIDTSVPHAISKNPVGRKRHGLEVKVKKKPQTAKPSGASLRAEKPTTNLFDPKKHLQKTQRLAQSWVDRLGITEAEFDATKPADVKQPHVATPSPSDMSDIEETEAQDQLSRTITLQPSESEYEDDETEQEGEKDQQHHQEHREDQQHSKEDELASNSEDAKDHDSLVQTMFQSQATCAATSRPETAWDLPDQHTSHADDHSERNAQVEEAAAHSPQGPELASASSSERKLKIQTEAPLMSSAATTQLKPHSLSQSSKAPKSSMWAAASATVLASDQVQRQPASLANISVLARAKARQSKTLEQRRQERLEGNVELKALKFMNEVTKDIAWQGAATPEALQILLNAHANQNKYKLPTQILNSKVCKLAESLGLEDFTPPAVGLFD